MHQSKVTSSLACIHGQVTKHTTVKWDYGGDRSRKDVLVHFGALERTQVLTGICGIRFIVIQINTSINLGHGFKKANALILRCR